MPAPGDQYRDTPASVNPFNDAKPSISKYTAQEIATLQSRLEKQLGPEYISTRPGAGGGKVHYLAAEKVINLANEVFGFNGWSSSIQNVQIDFVDENPSTQRINLGLSTIVRVTLRDGAFHEDIGYGHCENVKGKAAAFEKAKKEAATDAMKRALRNFGNVLGNCLYDKDYLSRITKVKVQPSKWDAGDLHRHRDFAPIKKEMATDEPIPQNKTSAVQRNASVQSNNSVGSFGSGEFEDDFGGNFFDDTDFSHPDEVRLDDTTVAEGGQDEGAENHQRQGMARTHSMPQMRPVNIQAPTPMQGMQAPQRPQAVPRPPTNAAQGAPPSRMGPPQTPGAQQRHNQQHQQQTNRPPQQSHDAPRSNPSSGGTTSGSPNKKAPQRATHGPNGQAAPARPNATEDNAMPPQPPPGAPVGFVTGRRADVFNQPTEARPLDASLAFNPHAESPSIRRTQGVNPGKSAPISRDLLSAAKGAQSPAMSANQQPSAPGGFSNASGNGFNGAPRPTNSNFVNPAADMNRKIGMPNSGPGGFPSNNRGAYKPHAGAKRSVMADVTNTYQPQTDGASDAKKPRVEAGAGEVAQTHDNSVATG
ncbi:unnamed protein product [Zymoseptoria tritici ST99CH_1A5]|uniref:RAD52 homolog n=1 Tax=Zymoseptoria tritici ST99CH_1A5 TaxID=1276529 RepID=A0A1Y6LY10_ZYMTR|nr:unnamed protein product [Zymoseptoria tritici ST99CH_1A5]